MEALFGSQVRTDVLVAIARLSQTYPTEIARVLGRRQVEVQRALASLEKSGALVSRRLGRTRIVELNPRYPQRDELYALLLAFSERPEYAKLWSDVRRRPRTIGKPLP